MLCFLIWVLLILGFSFFEGTLWSVYVYLLRYTSAKCLFINKEQSGPSLSSEQSILSERIGHSPHTLYLFRH